MGLEFLFRRLGPAARDQFISILNEAGSDDSLARSEKIDAQIDAIRRRLDEKFKLREASKERMATVEMLLESIGEPNDDLETAALKLWLTSHRQELRDRIAEFHPEEDLRQKLELTHARDMLQARRKFSQLVSSRLLIPARSMAEHNGKRS